MILPMMFSPIRWRLIARVLPWFLMYGQRTEFQVPAQIQRVPQSPLGAFDTMTMAGRSNRPFKV